jgi:DNA polymerase III delta prime subunit
MTDSTQLQTIFKHIEAGKSLTNQDLKVLAEAVRSQQVTFVTGDRSVSIGESADGTVIVTGDRNVVLTATNARDMRRLLSDRHEKEKLLLERVKNEVKTRLEKSLHNAVLIDLGLQDQSHKIQHPWSSEIKTGEKSSSPIPISSNISDIFDGEANGRLLILGKPGAGKTTTMLELTQALVEKAEQDDTYPVPVILSLSSWEIGQSSIYDWLIIELQSKYGMNSRLSKRLLVNQRLALLLDGLDELKSICQAGCIQAINRFLESNERPQHLAISSRTEEYDVNQIKLKLTCAICIKDLDNSQIQEYLNSINCQDLWHILNGDQVLLQLLRQPFWLSIFILSAGEISAESWNQSVLPEERLLVLLNAYFYRMTARKALLLDAREHSWKQEKSIDSELIKKWLSHLADQMRKDSKVEFLIEDLHSGYLPIKSQNFLYKRVSIIIFYIFSTIILNLGGLFLTFLLLSTRWGYTLFLAFETFVLASSAILTAAYFNRVNFSKKIAVVETIGWSSNIAFMNFRAQIMKAWEEYEDFVDASNSKKRYRRNSYIYQPTIFSILLILIRKVFSVAMNILYFAFFICAGIFSGLYEMLKTGITTGEALEKKTIPNQGIKRSQENYIAVILVWMLVFVVLFTVLGLILPPPFQSLRLIGIPIGFFVGSFIGLYLGIDRGGKAYIQHISIRSILWLSGIAPRNYVHFLD